MRFNPIIVFVFLFGLLLQNGCAQNRMITSSKWLEKFSKEYNADVDVVYHKVNESEVKLDAYYKKNSEVNTPVVITLHGGGWARGSKDAMSYFNYLEAGWAVVNVEYRMMGEALAPAAVVDCRCALAWVYENAKKYHFDTSKVIITGTSAGGHLALITGMLPAHSEFDFDCVYKGDLKVAAIFNNYGPVELAEYLVAPNINKTISRWFGDQPNRVEIAKKISPMTYVHKGIPPIFTAHGTADPTVPFEHATRLHKALDAAGVPNELFPVQDGVHGKFSKDKQKEIYEHLSTFLEKNIGLKCSFVAGDKQ